VSGDVRAYGVSGDDHVPTWMRSCDGHVLKEWRSNCWAPECSEAVPNSGIGRLAKSIASFNPVFVGPDFQLGVDFGRFLVGLGPVRVDFSSVDFGRIFSTVLDVDFGYFCPRLQFDVKRRVYLCFRPFGTRF
jgi:hypothetical protein